MAPPLLRRNHFGGHNEAGRSIWRSRWAPDIDCHSKSLGEWRFIFPICMRRCATIKAQLALRRQWFAFTNHVGSVLIASTSGRGALLSPRARCLWSFVSTFFLIDYTRTIFHSPPGFSGHLIELPNAAPPHPVLFSEPQMASAHTSVLSRQSAQPTPRDVPPTWQIRAKKTPLFSLRHPYWIFMYITYSLTTRTNSKCDGSFG